MHALFATRGSNRHRGTHPLQGTGRLRGTGLFAGAVVLALGLTACGGSDNGQHGTPGSATAAGPTTDSTAGSPTAESGGPGSSESGGPGSSGSQPATPTSGGSKAGGYSGPAATITWATESSGPQLEAEKKVVAAFHDANPSITVTVDAVAFDSYDTKLTTALRAGTGPDVFRVNHPNIQAWTNAKFLAPLDDVGVDTAPFIPALVTAGQVNGTQYTLPMDTDARALFYNPDLLKKAGIDAPPATWAELLSDVTKVKATGAYGYAFRNSGDYDMAYETVGPYMNTAGGELLTKDGAQAGAANSAGTVAAVQLIQDIVKAGVVPPGQTNMTEDTMNQLFAQGKLAFMVGGPWERPTILKDNPKAVYGKDFATAPIPTQQSGGKSASTSGGWQIGIAASSKSPAAAKALLAFLEQPDNLIAIAESSTFPPLTTGLESEPWKSDPFYDAYKTVLPNSGLPIPPVPQLAQIAAALQKNVAPAVLGGSPAKDALSAFDTQVNQQILRR